MTEQKASINTEIMMLLQFVKANDGEMLRKSIVGLCGYFNTGIILLCIGNSKGC